MNGHIFTDAIGDTYMWVDVTTLYRRFLNLFSPLTTEVRKHKPIKISEWE